MLAPAAGGKYSFTLKKGSAVLVKFFTTERAIFDFGVDLNKVAASEVGNLLEGGNGVAASGKGSVAPSSNFAASVSASQVSLLAPAVLLAALSVYVLI